MYKQIGDKSKKKKKKKDLLALKRIKRLMANRKEGKQKRHSSLHHLIIKNK